MALVSATKVVRRRPPAREAHRFVLSRGIFRLLSGSLLILMPLLGIFRADVEGHYVLLFWQRLPMWALAIALPVLIIVPLASFFLLSLKYGRLFCSWACPQGAVNEAAAKSHLALWGRPRLWPTKRDRIYPKSARRRAVRWQAKGRAWWLSLARYATRALLLPPVAAFAAVSYAVDPAHLWNLLATGTFSSPAVVVFICLSGIFYADLILLQETACRACFFGYLQSVASYSRPTGVRRNPELKSLCHGCSVCRDSCFVGVDPRQRAWEWARGTDLIFDNCISCGDCLVACDDVTSRRGVPLIMELPPAVGSR